MRDWQIRPVTTCDNANVCLLTVSPSVLGRTITSETPISKSATKRVWMAAIGRVSTLYSRCATSEQPIEAVPFSLLKQGRFQGVDVTNIRAVLVRGS